jgi:hypothetical protein
MALERREVEIPLNGGLDTKQNTELQDPATFTQLENLRWNRVGELEKIPTHNVALSVATPLSGSRYSNLGCSTVLGRGSEVCVLTGNHGLLRRVRRVDANLDDSEELAAMTASETVGSTEYDDLTWAPSNAIVSRKIVDSAQMFSVAQLEFGYINAASATCKVGSREIVVVATVSTRQSSTSGFVRVRAIDAETWTTIRESESITISGDALGVDIRACATSETNYEGVIVTYSDGTTAPIAIAAVRYDARTNEFVSVGNLTTNAQFQGHALAGEIDGSGLFYFAYTDNTSGLGVVETRTLAGGVSATHNSTRTFSAAPALVVGLGQVLITYVANALTSLYAETLGNPGASITINTLASGIYGAVSAARELRSGITNAAVVAVEVIELAANCPFAAIKYGLVDFTAAAPVSLAWPANNTMPNAMLLGSVTLNGRAHFALKTIAAEVELYGGFPGPASGLLVRVHFPYAGGTYGSGKQRVDVVARFAHDRLNANLPFFIAPLSVTVIDSTRARFSVLLDFPIDKIVIGGGTYVYPPALSVALVEVDVTPRPMPTAQHIDTAFVGGGMLHSYDGSICSENSFVTQPLIVIEDNGAGAITAAAGAFKAAAVYVFQDAAGNLHRSAPGFGVYASSLAAERVDVYVSLPPATSQDGFTWNRIGVELYILASDGVYRLAQDASGGADLFDVFTTNTPGGVVFEDVAVPTVAEPPLYSDGTGSAELVSEPTPATHSIAVIGDRLWLLDSEDRSRVWFSKPFVAGYAPEFNTANTLTIGDECVAVTDVNGVPTVFGRSGIWQIYGDGPNALGFGSFAPARKLPHQVECMDAASVCKTSVGVFFRGRRGVYLLGNGLDLQPVGQAVDAEMAVSGKPEGFCKIGYDELSSEVHVLDFDGRHYVFNVREQKWSEWDNTDARSGGAQDWKDCASIDGALWYLHEAFPSPPFELRKLAAYDEASYNLSTQAWELTTPWIRLDGPTGFSRIWELQVSVKTNDLSNVGSLTLLYNTRDGTSSQVSWTAANLADAAGDDDIAVLRFKPHQQIVSAFKITLTQEMNAESSGCSPISMRVIGGVRPGGYRRRSARQLKAGSVPS